MFINKPYELDYSKELYELNNDMINIMSYLRYILIKSLYDKINNIKTVYRNVLMKYLVSE